MASHECLLDAHGILRGDPVPRQGSEACRHPVDVAALRHGVLDDSKRRRHALTDVISDLDRHFVPGYVDDLPDREGLRP
jgi:hypothetical protein